MSAEKLTGETRAKVIAEAQARGWSVDEARGALSKTFTFKNFSEAFGWMTRAAMVAEQLGHHPEWSNVYKTVEVTLTTHDVDGLSDLDAQMASKMDALAG